MSAVVEDILWAVGLLAIMLLSLEVGFRAGSRAAEGGDTKGAGQVGAIQGAMLGLLGLLLGFSFAAAGARFLERQDLIVSEANAIGTAYARAELLDLPHRGDLRRALAEYTDHRLKVAGRIRGGLTEADYAAVNAYHTRMWNAARAGVEQKPAFALAVLDPVNAVIDLHTTRLAAGAKHIPWPVMGLLVACSMLSVGVIGYGCGTSRRRRAPFSMSLATSSAAPCGSRSTSTTPERACCSSTTPRSKRCGRKSKRPRPTAEANPDFKTFISEHLPYLPDGINSLRPETAFSGPKYRPRILAGGLKAELILIYYADAGARPP